MPTIRGARADEREAIGELIAAAFSRPYARQPEVLADLANDEDYAPERTLVAEVEGRLVGHLVVKRCAVSLAGRWLPIARLGTVCVAPDGRRRGIGRALVEAALARVPEVAAVFLNPAPEDYVRRFYEVQGFVAAQRTRCAVLVDRQWAVAGPTWPAVRPAEPGDAAVLDELYRSHYGPRTGTLSRSPGWWRSRLAGRRLLWSNLTPRWWVALDGGRPVAYLGGCDDDVERVWEWACAPGAEAAARGLLQVAAASAGPAFRVHLPPDDPLRRLLTEARDDTPEPGPVMVRARALDPLAEALRERLAAGGARLMADATPTVEAAGARLRLSWSELLAAVYDGAVIEPWLAAGRLELTPATPAARAALAMALPARAAGRRPTDAF